MKVTIDELIEQGACDEATYWLSTGEYVDRDGNTFRSKSYIGEHGLVDIKRAWDECRDGGWLIFFLWVSAEVSEETLAPIVLEATQLFRVNTTLLQDSALSFADSLERELFSAAYKTLLKGETVEDQLVNADTDSENIVYWLANGEAVNAAWHFSDLLPNELIFADLVRKRVTFETWEVSDGRLE